MDTLRPRRLFTLTAALTLALSALQQLSTTLPAWAQTHAPSAAQALNWSDLPRWEAELRPELPVSAPLASPTHEVKRTLLDHLNARHASQLQIDQIPLAPEHSFLGGVITSRFELHLVLPAAGSPAALLGAEFQPSRNRLNPSEINGVASDFLNQLLAGAPLDFPIACGFEPAGLQAAPDFLGTLTCVQGAWTTETAHWKKTAKKISVPRPINIARNQLRRSIRQATRALDQCLGHCPPLGSSRLPESRTLTLRGRERVSDLQKTAPEESLNNPGLITIPSGCEKNKAVLLSQLEADLNQNKTELEQLRLSAKPTALPKLQQLEAERQEIQSPLAQIERALAIGQEEKALREKIEDATQNLMFQVPTQAKVVIHLDISISIIDSLDYAVSNVSFLIQRLKAEQSFNLILNDLNVFALADHQLLPATQENKDRALAMLNQLLALKAEFGTEDSGPLKKLRKKWRKIISSKEESWPLYATYLNSRSLPEALQEDTYGEPAPAYFLANATRADLVLSFTDGGYAGAPQTFSSEQRRSGSTYQVQLKPMLKLEDYDGVYHFMGFSLEKLIDLNKRDELLDFKHDRSDFTAIRRLLGELDALAATKESLARQLNPELKKMSQPELPAQEDWLDKRLLAALTALKDQLTGELERVNQALAAEKNNPEIHATQAKQKVLQEQIDTLQAKQALISQQQCPDNSPASGRRQ